MFVYIEGPNNALAHNYRQEFTYGPGRSRRLVKTYEDGVHIKSRVYAGGVYEEVTDHTSGTTEKHHYIYGGDGLAAILVTQGATENLYYVHKDYLGSILALSDESGNIVESYSFDAWGHRRNPNNWSQWDNGTNYITNRGFTGHEHMDFFGLINMNGRVYDPDLGRFISPDPYVQMPNNSQNFNRYSYALNNPLVYTDPSGEFIFTALSAIFAPALLPIAISADLGTYFGGKAANNGEWNPLDWKCNGKTWAGMGIGAVVGGLTGYAGASGVGLNLTSSMGLAGFGMTSGMVNGAVYSGIASGWNAEAMFMGAWGGGVGGALSGMAMTGMGAAWNAISYGNTGTFGDAIREGLGELPGLSYTKWSMSRVIWTGLNLPSARSMLTNASQLVNGALHGQWGSKLVPAGEYRFDYERFTYGPINQSQNINQNFDPRYMRLRTGGGLWSQIDQAGYYGNAFNNRNDVFRLTTGNQNYMVRGNHSNENMNILSNRFSMNLSLTPGSSGQLYIYGQTYRRYLEDINPPWWVRFFFGIQNQP